MHSDKKAPSGPDESKSERFRRLHEMLDQALQVSPEKRSLYLDEATQVDAEMRRELASLLKSFGPADRFEAPAALDALTTEHYPGIGGHPTVLGHAPFEPGMRVGVYRLERELGAGGAGQVFLASRDDDAYEKKVAVKVLKRGMDTDELVRRFRSERQILARLEHQNIAKLLDGGATIDGRPFLVMEYVADGRRITDWCRKEELGLEERLHLFLSVCRAVRFAHGHLIVHRDLKPDNILVSHEGEVKLLDFGIAKLLDPAAFPGTVVPTGPGWRAMTPEYASPEQVRGELVTTASDVYSLGVVLYELLVGRRPYDIEVRSVSGVERAIARAETPVASRAASEFSAQGSQHAKRLAGDLDDILRMALEKDPERRYPSVDQLEADLRRHLEGLPVKARRSSAFYRTSKFLGRHRLGVSAVTLLLLMVLAFSAALLLQRADILHQRDRAEETSAFLINLFTLADPSHSRGEQITAREILDRGASDAEARLGNRPGLLGDLLATMGTTYLGLGLYDEAEAMFERTLALHGAAYGPQAPALAATTQQLANLYRATDRLEAAEQLTQQALRLRSESDPNGRVESLLELATLRRIQGAPVDSEKLFQEVVKELETLDATDLSIRAFTEYGTLATSLDQHDQSRRLFEEAERLSISHWGEKHPERIRLLNRQAMAIQWSDPAWAQELLEKALELHDTIYSEPHPEKAYYLSNLALNHEIRGQLEEAERVIQEAIALEDSRFAGPTHRRAALLSNFASILNAAGRQQEAEEIYRQSVTQFAGTVGPHHEDTMNARHNLAGVLVARGRLDEAEALWQETHRALVEVFGAGHSRVAAALSNLGHVAKERGDFEKAGRLFDRAAGLLEAISPTQPELPAVLANQALIARQSGEPAKAVSLAQRALDVLSMNGQERGFPAAEVHLNLIVALAFDGQNEAAEAVARRAVALYEELQGAGSERWLRARRMLGNTLDRQGKIDEARALALENLEICLDNFGAGSEICNRHDRYREKLRALESAGVEGTGL